MKLTMLSLSKEFPIQIGFVEEVRRVMQIPLDPAMLELFKRLVPKALEGKLQTTLRPYDPPRWMGYWISAGTPYASNGYIRLKITKIDIFNDYSSALQRLHYRGKTTAPFIEALDRSPTHMLVHDTHTEAVFVTPFEQGEAVLVRQKA